MRGISIVCWLLWEFTNLLKPPYCTIFYNIKRQKQRFEFKTIFYGSKSAQSFASSLQQQPSRPHLQRDYSRLQLQLYNVHIMVAYWKNKRILKFSFIKARLYCGMTTENIIWLNANFSALSLLVVCAVQVAQSLQD